MKIDRELAYAKHLELKAEKFLKKNERIEQHIESLMSKIKENEAMAEDYRKEAERTRQRHSAKTDPNGFVIEVKGVLPSYHKYMPSPAYTFDSIEEAKAFDVKNIREVKMYVRPNKGRRVVIAHFKRAGRKHQKDTWVFNEKADKFIN